LRAKPKKHVLNLAAKVAGSVLQSGQKDYFNFGNPGSHFKLSPTCNLQKSCSAAKHLVKEKLY
jgi:hypothetical protein